MDNSPLDVLSGAIGQPVWLITKDPLEYTGTLLGFDEYVNVVLADAVAYEPMPESGLYSQEPLGTVLINGNVVEVIVPNGKGPSP